MTAPGREEQWVENRAARRAAGRWLRRVQVEGSGSCMRVKLRGQPRRGGGLRGKIDNRFSQGSRRRMLEKAARMDRRNFEHALCGDLTYGRIMEDGGQVDRDLEEVHRRILRVYGECWAFWKKEWQRRGSLHVHFIFGGPVFIHMDWLQEQWGEIIGQWVPFTRIERMRSKAGAMKYLAKYMAKVDDAEHRGPGGGAAQAAAPPGSRAVGSTDVTYSRKRCWGVKGRKHVIEGIVVRSAGEVPQEVLERVRVKARGYWKHVGDRGGFLLYLESGCLGAFEFSSALGLCAEASHSDAEELDWFMRQVEEQGERECVV